MRHFEDSAAVSDGIGLGRSSAGTVLSSAVAHVQYIQSEEQYVDEEI